MPILRACTTCGRQNRIYADHLAETGRCGALQSTAESGCRAGGKQSRAVR